MAKRDVICGRVEKWSVERRRRDRFCVGLIRKENKEKKGEYGRRKAEEE